MVLKHLPDRGVSALSQRKFYWIYCDLDVADRLGDLGLLALVKVDDGQVVVRLVASGLEVVMNLVFENRPGLVENQNLFFNLWGEVQ